MRVFILLLALNMMPTVVGADDRIAAEAFSRLPETRNVRLSPNGLYIAYLKNIGHETVLVTRDLTTDKIYGLVKTDNKRYKISWLKWANDDQIVFGVRYPSAFFVTFGETRLMVIDKEGEGGAKSLLRPRTRIKGKRDHPAQFQDRVISWLPDDPDHILVSVDFDKPL